MNFEQLKDNQKEVIQILSNSYKKDKLTHAYIFDGEKGAGCLEVALYFACMLLCKNESSPCLKCNTCTRIIEKNHSNVIIVEPTNGTIKKEQITDLIKEFSMSGLEDGPRIYIINEADKLNPSSSNALLKFLEEPVPNRYAIIITQNYRSLLDTIISRCQLFHFKPLKINKVVENYQSFGINRDAAYILAHITSDIDEAKQLINDGTIGDLLDLAKKINEDINKNNSPYVSFYTKNKVLKESNNKDIHHIFLTILMLICEEKIKYINHEENYYFASIVNKISLKKNPIEKIIKELEIYSKYKERIKYNVNIDLQYASMFVEIESEVE